MKRTAIGEGAFYILIAAVVTSFVLYALGISSFLMMFVNIGGFFAIFTLAGTLIVTYSWSYRCTPALPVSLADDLFALLVFVLFPKSPVYGGLADQAEYTNLTCYACAGWRDNVWTFPSFTRSLQKGGRFGFEDLSFNIVFTLKHYFPALLADIRRIGPTIPFIGSLFNIDVVKARLAAYDFYNRSALTQKAHAQFTGGNIITTFINLAVLALVFALLYVFSDLIEFLVKFIKALLGFVAMNVVTSLVALWATANLVYSPGGLRPPRDEIIQETSKRNGQSFEVEMVSNSIDYSPL
jgi:hypothetical protein